MYFTYIEKFMMNIYISTNMIESTLEQNQEELLYEQRN